MVWQSPSAQLPYSFILVLTWLFVFISDALQKSLKEKDLYSAKLKTLVLKARKDSDSIKQQLQAVEMENAQLKNKLSDLDSQLQVRFCYLCIRKVSVTCWC